MPRRALSILLLLLAGCRPDPSTDKTGETGDTGGGGDTGETDDPIPTGCITVDGGGGYANISDAIAVATDGSVVSLCAGTWNETVVIDKALTLEGPGMDEATLVAPTNEPAIEIAADGVTIRGVALEGTRSGVVVDGFADTRLVAVGFLAVDNYGVEASDVSNLSVEGCTFNATAYGGVQVDGGTASVVDSTFNDNVGFAIKGVGGAELVVSNNSITGTTPTDPDEVVDGHGIWLVESSAALSANVLTDNAFVGIYADSSALTLSGDSVEGSLYGVAHILEDLSVDGVTLTDNYYYGLFAITDQPVEVTGAVISGDPASVVDVDTDLWGDEDVGYLGVGLYVAAPTVTVSSSTVTGYNNAGLLLGSYDDSGCVASLDGVTLADNGRIGMYVLGADLLANDVTVQGVIDIEEGGDSQCYTVDTNAAASLIQSSATWTGGAVQDNDGYGIASLYSALELEGATISGNACGGVMNYGGALVAQGNTFSASGNDSFEAGLVSYQGSSTAVVGNTFVDNQVWTTTYDYEYDDGAGTTYHYQQYGYTGYDLQIFYGGTNTIEGNTFTTGTNSVYAYDADVEIEDNTWTDYRGVVFQVGSSEGNTLTIKDATVDGFYSYGAYCSQATLDISDSTFQNGGNYYYEYYSYVNDELSYSYTGEYANQTLYGYDCTMVAEDVDVLDTNGGVLTGNGGSYELTGIKGQNVGNAGSTGADTIYLSSYSYYYYDTSSGSEYESFYEVEAWLSDVTLDGVVAGNGITVIESIYEYYGDGADDPDTLVHLDGVTLNDIDESGLRLETSGTVETGPEVDVSDLVISGAADGVYASTGTLSVENAEISDVTGEALDLTSSTVSLSGLTISGAGADAVTASGGSLTMTGSSVDASAGTGLVLSSLTAEVTGNTITGSAGYGMECSEVTFSACGNDLSGNTLGEQTGCDESCATPE